MSNRPDIKHYAWIDVETTGLDRSRDPIIEMAVVLTDLDLNQKYAYTTPINVGPGLLKARLDANPYVREMHSNNGLLSCLESDRRWPTIEEAANWIIRSFERFSERQAMMIAGSGVAQFDQPLIRFQVPKLDEWFAYHPMDIGVIRRFIKHTLKRSDLLLPDPPSTHRAMDDVMRALREARYYRDMLGEVPVVNDEEG